MEAGVEPAAAARRPIADVRVGVTPWMRAVVAWTPPSVWVAVVVQTVFLIVFAATDGYDVARSGEAVRVLLTYATVVALFGFVHLVVGARSHLASPVTLGVFALFVGVNIAQQVSSGSFDYGFVHDNARELLTPLGRHVAAANLNPGELALLLLIPLVAGYVLRRTPPRPWPGFARSRYVAALACLGVVVGLPAARVSTHESLTAFVASAIRFHAEARAAETATGGTPFPFVRELVPSARARMLAPEVPAPRPHVILLFLESWSGLFSDKLRADGRPYTPVFDARRREGLTFDYFYGNSIQSSRGHFATLCSVIPLYRGKEFTSLPDTRLRCLPEVLTDAGYRTLFYSATAEPKFDESDVFLGRIGFSEVLFQEPHDPKAWGMGVQDDEFYRRFFALLDERIARADGPVFAVAANASNHYPFSKSPAHVPDPDEPTRYRRNFVASLAAADAWLSTFFAELERRPALRDAIVVLVGDHSFPADEHGIHINMLGAYEEAFRTAFALRWGSRVSSDVVKDRAASQIDIAPTIADLLQLRGAVHFAGRSLFDEAHGQEPSPMVQPYDGVRLVSVRYPFKLVRHASAEQESLYDLSRDPREEDDRIGDPSLAGELVVLREALGRIHSSQALVRANRVWPPSAR